MRLELETNAGKAKRQFDVMAANLPAAINEGVKAETRVVYHIARRKISDIGNLPIPTRKEAYQFSKTKKRVRRNKIGTTGGKLAWERTGALLRGLRMATAGPRAMIRVFGPAAKYAHRQHQLGQPDDEFGEGWMPQNPAMGIIRRHPFFGDAKRITEPQRGIKFVQAVRNKLGLRG